MTLSFPPRLAGVLSLLAISLSPCWSAAPSLSARRTTNGIDLAWTAPTNYDSQVETSLSLVNWQPLWPPYAAPPVQSIRSNSYVLTNAQFFRIRYQPLTNSPVPIVPGIYSLSLASGGLARTYRLNLPAGYNPANPAPLAFILHGHGQTADSFAAQHPALAQLAQSAGMILVFPQSTTYERGTGWVNYDTPEVNDSQFIVDLLNHLDRTLKVDRRRVYAGGFSNGGQMVHFLAARTTNLFAAYAAVASSIGGGKGDTNIVLQPPPSEPNSILIVNATNDCARPFWGGLNDNLTAQPAAMEAVLHWTTNNHCVTSPIVSRSTNAIAPVLRPNFGADCPETNPPPGILWTNHVTRSTWLGGTNATEVVFVELSDGGHLWPDAADNVGFDANAEVMAFFLRHCRCDATGVSTSLSVPTTPGQHDRAYCDQGYWRRFRLQVPAAYTGASAHPLVFALHDGDQTIDTFSTAASGLFTKCNLENTFLVLPEATVNPETRATSWNHKPVHVVVDDRSFLTNLLEQLDASLNLNRRRIYLCGFANGGRMGFWLGATHTNVLAAVGTVGAMTGWNDPTNAALVPLPAPLEPLPVMMTRGTMDGQLPWNGGPNNTGTPTFSAYQDLAYWAAGNVCAAPAVTTVSGSITNVAHTGCRGSSEVQLDIMDGLGHVWPQGATYNASTRIVDFLLRFTRP